MSKLNTLLGTKVVPDRSLALFQTVGVSQRPTYDLIAERVLGPQVGEPTSFLDAGANYASHVAKRLVELQRRMEQPPLPQSDGEGFYVGVEDDGTPVWSQVLSEQRGRTSNKLGQVRNWLHPSRGSFTTQPECWTSKPLGPSGWGGPPPRRSSNGLLRTRTWRPRDFANM